jgi:predicted N-acetyltransferase YhbS
MADPTLQVSVRNTTPRDFKGIAELCRRVYPETPPWNAEQLSSHLRAFPEGQFVAVYGPDETVVGMTASLIVDWDSYKMLDSWERFTADGMFTNHDPRSGRTLYGAEVIVDPTLQHHGIGDKLYGSRRSLTESLKLRRIRAGSRLRGYHECAARLKPEEYVTEVVEGVQYDPTLSFQLQEGFHVLAVVPHYLSDDPESLGYAAVIEWLNPQLIRPEHVADRPTRFLRKNPVAGDGPMRARSTDTPAEC